MADIPQIAEDFEGPESAGTALSTSNTTFNALTGSGTSVFSTTSPHVGSKCATITAAASNRSLEGTIPAESLVWLGFALRVDTSLSAVSAICNGYLAGTLVSNLRLNSNRTLNFRDNATSRWTSSTVLTVGSWYEIRLLVNAGGDVARVKIYDGLGELLEDSGNLTLNLVAAATIDEFRMGLLTGSVNGVISLDSIVADDATEPPSQLPAGYGPFLYYDTGSAWVDVSGSLYYDDGTQWVLVEPAAP